MKYLSTRDKSRKKRDFAECLTMGLAEDGGLFVAEDFSGLASTPLDYLSSSKALFQLFSPEFESVTAEAFNFPIVLNQIADQTQILELFHGPTAAFKDVGARFLSQCFKHLNLKTNILVATSGDTGGAVASAFEDCPGIDVFLLFPAKGVSQLQHHQLCCWGPNIHSFAVDGTFDDCQSMVKNAVPDLRSKISISSANSINIGRLIPQMTYYYWSSCKIFADSGQPPSYHIPTGNMGNAMAAIWAKLAGAPIAQINLACNSNRTITEYFKTGKWQASPSIPTIANAMDVGHPSNMERFLHQFPDGPPAWISAHSFSDSQIKAAISNCYSKTGKIICPHTATAYASWKRSNQYENTQVLVSTASPAKFKSIVEPLILKEIQMPPSLVEIQSRQENFESITTDLPAFVSRVLQEATR